MDLRPINPYYRQAVTYSSRLRLRALLATYSYPYTWQEPVTDRTQSDAEHARELLTVPWSEMTAEQQTEYSNGLKGCMNWSDFARIENNIQILLDVLEIDNTSYVEAVPEFLTESYFENMKENVTAIREGYCVHEDTPQVPELPYNTWEKYNAVEKILADVYEVVSAQFHYYAGDEIYAGDDTGALL